jgi:hypothetical protein
VKITKTVQNVKQTVSAINWGILNKVTQAQIAKQANPDTGTAKKTMK